jgi:hypothetical protein
MPIIYPLHGFFDESGKLKDTESFCIGGCVMTAELRNLVTAQWAQVLFSESLSHTSMKDAINFHGPYREWKGQTERRDAVLRKLAGILMNNRVGCMSVSVKSSAFAALSQDEQEQLWKNIYYPAFEGVILGFLEHADADLTLYFDLAEEYSERCVKLFNLLRTKRPEAKKRCLGISFLDDEVTPCLQMADMISYCGRIVESELPSKHAIVNELIEALRSDDRRVGRVVYKTRIGDGEVVWK